MKTQEVLDPQRWAERTFGSVALKDTRRTRRAVWAATQMARNASASLPQQMQTWKDVKALLWKIRSSGEHGRGEIVVKKSKTATFLVELPVVVEEGAARRVRAHLEAARQLYNALLSEGLHRLRQMRADPAWQAARDLQKQERKRAFTALREQYGFNEYALHAAAKILRVMAAMEDLIQRAKAGHALTTGSQTPIFQRKERSGLCCRPILPQICLCAIPLSALRWPMSVVAAWRVQYHRRAGWE